MTGTNKAELVLSGNLDIARAKELHVALVQLLETSPGDIELECSGVERIDASGAQLLVALERALRARGSALTVVGIPERVARLLATSGLDSLISPQEDINVS